MDLFTFDKSFGGRPRGFDAFLVGVCGFVCLSFMIAQYKDF